MYYLSIQSNTPIIFSHKKIQKKTKNKKKNKQNTTR